MEGSIELAGACRYALRTFGTRAGLWGLIKEGAWLAAHLAFYPGGAVREQLEPAVDFRTDPLSPLRRSLVVTDPEAAGTPILLIHGIMDNRSVFTVFRRALRRRGFGVVHAVNYGLFTGDLREAAHELQCHVERLCEATGAGKVHIVGHSLGGVIARYYVQRLGGSAHVDTLVTLGSPHSGTLGAYLIPTALGRQLRPGSPPLTELAEPAPACTTRFLVVWSRMDQMVLPQGNARLQHPDLDVAQFELPDVGHLALPIDGRVVRWVVETLARSDRRHAASPSGDPSALDTVINPAS
jgi:pimeloyl-ACP methyl ester carboxylesterase